MSLLSVFQGQVSSKEMITRSKKRKNNFSQTFSDLLERLRIEVLKTNTNVITTAQLEQRKSTCIKFTERGNRFVTQGTIGLSFAPDWLRIGASFGPITK